MQALQFQEMLSLILLLFSASHQTLIVCICIKLFPMRSSGNVTMSLSVHGPRSRGDLSLLHLDTSNTFQI